MKRGDRYLLRRPGGGDPKKQWVMIVVSRQALVDSRFPTVICAPVFSRGHGLETEVSVGPEDGLKHASWIACDGLVSIPKTRLTDYVGALPAAKLALLSRALSAALDLF
jgi:mRNA interferase MazF